MNDFYMNGIRFVRDVYVDPNIVNLWECYTETEHVVNASRESINQSEHVLIRSFAMISEPFRSSEIVGNKRFNHAECRVEARFHASHQVLPTAVKGLSFVQFRKNIDHSIVYGNGDNLSVIKYEVDVPDLDYGETGLDGFAVDSREPGKLCSAEISAEMFNRERVFSFTDQRWSMWCEEHNGCPFSAVSIKQMFSLFLCAQTTGGEMIPIKGWTWGYSFLYNRHGGPTKIGIELRDVKHPELLGLFGDLHRICRLPNADSRLIEISMAMENPSEGD